MPKETVRTDNSYRILLLIHLVPPTVPQYLAIKDNIATTHHPTTCASGILQNYKSPFDASILRIFRHKYVMVGKTNMDEFGMGSHSTNSLFGPVHNNHPYEHLSAGGSSGGSAVAVASGQCDIALGTDTGGSVRLPAAYTGIVGYKPSYGLVSRWGVVPYANSLDCVGFLAQSAEKSRLFDPWDSKDPTSVSPKARARMRENLDIVNAEAMTASGVEYQLKIGLPIEYNIAELDPGIRNAWQNLLTTLQARGCIIVPISLPHTKIALSAYYIIAAAEAASNLSKYDGVRYGHRVSPTDSGGDVLYSETRGRLFGSEAKRRILLGSYTLSSDAIDNYFIKAQKVRRLVQRDFDSVFRLQNPLRPPQQFDLSDMDEAIPLDSKLGPSQVDFIICPTAPTLAPTLDSVAQQTPLDSYVNDVFTVPASLAGLPAISIPVPIAKDIAPADMPHFAGMQIIGQYSDDERLLSLAIKIETLLQGMSA